LTKYAVKIISEIYEELIVLDEDGFAGDAKDYLKL